MKIIHPFDHFRYAASTLRCLNATFRVCSFLLFFFPVSLVGLSGALSLHADDEAKVETQELQEPEAEAETPSIFEATTPTGRIKNTGRAYMQRVEGYETFANSFELEIEETFTWGSHTVKLRPWTFWMLPMNLGGNTSSDGNGSGTSFLGTAGTKSEEIAKHFEFKEAWWEYGGKIVDIRIGNQIISWGSMDQLNPTDVWNSKILWDPFASEKLPLMVAKATVHPPALSQWNLETVVTPYFRQHLIPVEFPDEGDPIRTIKNTDNRWMMPIPTSVVSGNLQIPLQFKMTAPSYPTTWQGGLRLKGSFIEGWDFSLIAFQGVEKNPRIYLAKTGSSDTPDLPLILTMNPSFHRETVLGFDGEGAFGSSNIGIRFEGAYHIPSNERLIGLPTEYIKALEKRPSFQVAAGVDYTFEKRVLFSTLYLNAMAILEQSVGGGPNSEEFSIISGFPNTTPLDRNLILYAENRFSDQWKIGQAIIMSLKNLDYFYSPSLTFSPNDVWMFSIGADIPFGKRTGFFGQFKDNRRVNISIQAQF